MRGAVCGLACSFGCVLVVLLSPTLGLGAGLRVACWVLSSASSHGMKFSLFLHNSIFGLFVLFLLQFLTENYVL